MTAVRHTHPPSETRPETLPDSRCPPPPSIRLSTLLRDVPATEAYLLMDRGVYAQAVLDGVFQAVPIPGKWVTKTYFASDGTRRRTTVQDEQIMVTDTFRAWYWAMRNAARLGVLEFVGELVTTEERLLSGQDDFHRLIEIQKRRRVGAGS